MKSDRWNGFGCRYWGVDPQIVRYSERPELWEGTDDLFAGIWPEYNHHGQVLNQCWGQLYDVFPQW